MTVSVGTDLIEIERIRRALARYARFRERCFTDGGARLLRLAPEPRAELRRPLRRQGGRRQGARLRGRPRFAWQEIEIAGRPKPAVRLSGRLAERATELGVGSVDLSMTHSRELAQAVAVATDG